MSIRLTPDLFVGYEDIDGQHRTLFQRLDAAIEAVEADDAAAAHAAMTKLGDYLMAHFGAEESFMNAAHYPERGRHKSAHDLFMQDFMQLGQELKAAGLSVPVVQWVTLRVPEWLKFHIQVNDVPLGRFLASKRFRPETESARVDKPRVS
jgi:hemerythrin